MEKKNEKKKKQTNRNGDNPYVVADIVVKI